MKRKQGISLIILVVTIIVIIILSTAVIQSFSNNNPIKSAKKTKEINNQSVLEEAANLAYLNWYSDDTMGTTNDTAKQYIEKELIQQGFSEHDVKKVEIVNNVIKVARYLPVIPDGFEYLTGTVTTGYVIKNTSDGNEFVWIPVDDMDEFEREDWELKDKYDTYSEPLNYNNTYASTSEKEEYNEMKKSVEKYHGFYIGRYEASENKTTHKAQSLANQPSWGNLKWGASMTDLSGGVVEKSRAVYPVSSATNEKDAVSTLVYGVQWDAMVRFLEKNYPGISKDSSGYGCYNDSLQNTGSNSKYAQNNIYDVCGNLYEWTMESQYANCRVYRGGYYGKAGDIHSLSTRCNNLATTTHEVVGFRLALYIK